MSSDICCQPSGCLHCPRGTLQLPKSSISHTYRCLPGIFIKENTWNSYLGLCGTEEFLCEMVRRFSGWADLIEKPEHPVKMDGEKMTPLVIYRNPGEGTELSPVYHMGILSQSLRQLRKQGDSDCHFNCPNHRILPSPYKQSLRGMCSGGEGA